MLKCAAANSTVHDDILRFANETRIGAVNNLTTDSLKWTNSKIPSYGEIGYLGLLYPRTLEASTPGLTWNNTEQTTNEFAFAIQKSPTGVPYQSDTEYLSCELWNATVSYTVETRNTVVGIENVHWELLNKFDPKRARVNNELYPGIGSPAYSGYSIGLASYLLGYVAWHKDNTRISLASTGRLDTTSLSTGAQYYNMTRDMNQAIQVVNTLQNPSSVRDISFREDVEVFALNVSLSMINDASLW